MKNSIPEIERQTERHAKNTLFYTDDSLEFCNVTESIGFLGNVNRQCSLRGKGRGKHKRKNTRNAKKRRRRRKGKRKRKRQDDLPRCKASKGKRQRKNDSEPVCCNGYRKQEVQETYDCKCKFHWCCKIQCETCSLNQTIGVCK